MPDPRDTDPLTDEDDSLWDPIDRVWVPRPSPLPVLFLGLIWGLVIGLLTGIFLATHVLAAPRPAQTTERVDLSALSSAGPTEAPRTASAGSRTGASPSPRIRATPTPRPKPPKISGATVRGTASFMDPKYGRFYLALPNGRGHRVLICGPAACVTRVSTDAGPDLAMQRAGRVADVSFADFATICGCDPWAKGLVRVSVGAVR